MTQEDKQLLTIALCGYLPYEVKISFFENTITKNRVCSPMIRFGLIKGRLSICTVRRVGLLDNEEPLPILRPLSCLTQQITQSDYNDGKPFVPFDELVRIAEGKTVVYSSLSMELAPLWMIDLLNRWKIDYRGLIDKGLAIADDGTNY